MDKHAEAHLDTTRRGRSERAEPRLPRYSRASFSSVQSVELFEQTYTLQDSKGRACIWLHVKSRAKEKKSWPLFCERDTIHGTIEVDFDLIDGAKAVSIALTGGVTAIGQEELVFLTTSRELWNAKISGKAPSSKMSWPFSIPIPVEVQVADKPKAKAESYRLPPTFSERASPAYIDYKLTATVKRGALRINQMLTTSIYYTPLTRAEPPSALRQAAYIENTSLIGPEGDPEGWKVISPIRMTGTLFKTRTVNVDCALALAKPMSFAAGSPIPIFAIFSSDDQQALDVLAAPAAMKCVLVRERLIGSLATRPGSGSSASVVRELMGTASFWPSQDAGSPEEQQQQSSSSTKRKLQGELELKKALRPTFTFPTLSLRYEVCMYPSQAPGFVHTDPDKPLFSERVSIHTLNALGVVPKSYAPPGYAHAAQHTWNAAAGYLENGDQRFIHYGGFQ